MSKYTNEVILGPFAPVGGNVGGSGVGGRVAVVGWGTGVTLVTAGTIPCAAIASSSVLQTDSIRSQTACFLSFIGPLPGVGHTLSHAPSRIIHTFGIPTHSARTVNCVNALAHFFDTSTIPCALSCIPVFCFPPPVPIAAVNAARAPAEAIDSVGAGGIEREGEGEGEGATGFLATLRLGGVAASRPTWKLAGHTYVQGLSGWTQLSSKEFW
jgi:hypothetical protein